MNIEKKERGKPMGLWFFIIFIGIWVLLQAYILPKFGIST